MFNLKEKIFLCCLFFSSVKLKVKTNNFFFMFLYMKFNLSNYFCRVKEF